MMLEESWMVSPIMVQPEQSCPRNLSRWLIPLSNAVVPDTDTYHVLANSIHRLAPDTMVSIISE
jgi:hypothetical protein